MFIEITALVRTGEATFVAYLKVHSVQHPLTEHREEVARACQTFFNNFRGRIQNNTHYNFDFPADMKLSASEWELLSNLFAQHVTNKMESGHILRKV